MWIIGTYNEWLNLKKNGEVKIRTGIWQLKLLIEKAVFAKQSSGAVLGMLSGAQEAEGLAGQYRNLY